VRDRRCIKEEYAERISTEWNRRNPEWHKFATAARLANKRYPGKITTSDIAEIVVRSGRICHWCEKQDLSGRDLTLEHLRPENDKDSIVVACLSCNARRRQRPRPDKKDEKRLGVIREFRQRWRAMNPDLSKCTRAAENANRRYPGTVTGADLMAVLERCGRTCHWCKKANLDRGDVTFEHLKPVNDPQHIVVACNSCNASKVQENGRRLTEEEKKEKERHQRREHRLRTGEKRAAYRRKYYEEHAEEIKARAKKYHQENREAIAQKKREYDKQYYQVRRQEKIKAAKEWKAQNRERLLGRRRELWALRRAVRDSRRAERQRGKLDRPRPAARYGPSSKLLGGQP
jgi:hypothetical protein